MNKSLLTLFLTALIVFLLGCSDEYKTPEDIEGTVAWLNANSALPVFPFGTDPIYIYFNSDKSKISQRMQDNIFNRPEIIEYLNDNFTCISVIPDSLSDSVEFQDSLLSKAELFRMFQVDALPSHYFFSKYGDLKGARTGYISLIEFKHLLRYFAEGYFEKYPFQDYLNDHARDLDTVWGEF